MIRLPTPAYWAVLVVLLLITLGFAGGVLFLSVSGKPVPKEIYIPMYAALSAFIAFLFGKEHSPDAMTTTLPLVAPLP